MSVKTAKIFAEVFADESIIISQDDKAKIGLDISAVDPDSSNTLQTGQLSIFIRPEYFIGTSSATHITDLESIVKNKNFSNTLKKEDKVRPIWVLFVDSGPDENSKYMKNIIQYAHLFRSLDLDYLTVRTHAPGQSAYNPVERSIASLSEKLASITLPIEEFGSHLNSQENYVDQEKNPFDEPEPSISWKWIEEHIQLCRYSLNIKKCKNRKCYSEYRAPDAAKLLDENNGFLPPTTKGKDGHFINPIHAFQYHDKLKILEYDRCYPSIPQELHQYNKYKIQIKEEVAGVYKQIMSISNLRLQEVAIMRELMNTDLKEIFKRADTLDEIYITANKNIVLKNRLQNFILNIQQILHS
ncbi:hypothetical protein C1646_762499 [Rhizophagus diaphanus]|nr:hypothetical protein C1646_762499 [Rhizophagus diaphanus] [Rhizophagus sp. MUCL 43196]